MKIAGQVVLLVALAAVVSVNGITDHTYVNNLSTFTVIATTSYDFPGTSQFVNRVIAPGTQQGDQYVNQCCNSVWVKLQVQGAANFNNARINQDTSLVLKNNADSTGVDVFISVYGYTGEPDGAALFTIFP